MFFSFEGFIAVSDCRDAKGDIEDLISDAEKVLGLNDFGALFDKK
tara:strand:- start:260 stop:394 length:135 start_codon:yes stop_codon:yes gene_type:complete